MSCRASRCELQLHVLMPRLWRGIPRGLVSGNFVKRERLGHGGNVRKRKWNIELEAQTRGSRGEIVWGAGHYLYEQQDAAPVRCYAASSLQVIPLPRPDMLGALGWSDRRLALDSGGLVNKQPSSGAPCLFRKSTTPNERLGTPDLPAPCVMWPRGTARRARKKPQNSRSKKRRWLGHVIPSSRCLGVVWLAVEPHPRPRPPWPLLFLLSSASLYPPPARALPSRTMPAPLDRATLLQLKRADLQKICKVRFAHPPCGSTTYRNHPALGLWHQGQP